MNITQKPKYNLLPAGEQILYTVYDANALTNYKVKYIASLYVYEDTGNITLEATLKATPNAAGVGIFDFSPILSSYVSPDYEGGKVRVNTGTNYSQANNTPFNVQYHDIHRIDEFATAKNSIKWYSVIFTMEGSASQVGTISSIGGTTSTSPILFYNGVLYDTDILNKGTGTADIGYNLGYAGFILNGDTDKFLTNSPTKQYLRENDYHTVGFFNNYDSDFTVGGSGATLPAVHKLKIQFYYNGSTTGSLLQMACSEANGGFRTPSSESSTKLIFAGVGIANLTASGLTIPANWDYYTVYARNDNSETISQDYSFYKQEEDCKGFETIRLTWLNKFGVWDYYNFNKKSVRNFNKESVSYEQQSGTWNESVFAMKGYKGGTRNFTNKVSERIQLNTDYITEEEGIWLEELFLSNDVFILEQQSTDNINEGIIRKYMTPVIIDSEEHIRKTLANDRLIQYSISITKSKNRNTHTR